MPVSRIGSGVVAVLALLACALPTAASAVHRRSLPIGPRLFDMGVADLNHDGKLDVFTTAHNNDASALLATGHNRFRPAPASLGFGQNLAFPGIEDVEHTPKLTEPGTYIYVNRTKKKSKTLFLRIDAFDGPAEVDLSFNPSRKVRNVKIHGGTIDVDGKGDNATGAHIHLAAGGAARMKVNTDVPVRFHSPGPTFVGADAVPAKSPDFALRLADVHSDVFADLDGDGTDDMFRVVGGLGGGIAKPRLRGRVRDVTRLWRGAGFRDADLGLQKDDCRGRQGGALDVNGDGLTDLFETCADPNSGAHGEPFVDYGKPGGGYDRQVLPLPGGVYRWVPVPGSRLPGLLILGKRATLWGQAGQGWQQIAAARLRGDAGQMTVGDFDRDGRPDVYASSLRGSTLLEISPHSMRPRNPKHLGLPGRSSAASWVDADGDGNLDLHSVPDGLFKNNGRRFHQSNRLRTGGRYAHLSWADFDNNGLREPVLARSDGEFTITDHAWWYGLHPLRKRPKHPWLEVSAPGNWLTAKITVKPNRGKSVVDWAGEAETSRFSQGHNRTYFSLPRKARRATVRVRTTDGVIHKLRTRVNRVVSVGP